MPTTLFLMAKKKMKKPIDNKPSPKPIANPMANPKNETNPKYKPTTSAKPKSIPVVAKSAQNSSDDELLEATEVMEKMRRLSIAKGPRRKMKPGG